MHSFEFDVSFILPHKGRENLLKETLASIAAQDFDLNRVQVVIVTQNEQLSSDALSVISGIASKIIYRPPNETISTLRNAGVESSGGEYLAFLDSDISLKSNWISAMMEELTRIPNCVTTSAVQVCGEQAPPLEIIRTGLSNAVIDSEVKFLPGRNLFLRRGTFEQVGGFPEHLVTCEDYYFTDKVSNLGKLYYTSKSEYVHLGEDKEYGQMFKKEIWRGQSNLQSIKGRKIPFSEIPSFLVPIWIGLCCLAAVVCLLLLNFLMFVFFIVLALLPVFLYSLRLSGLMRGKLGFYPIIKFYLLYFPARVLGTFVGLFKVIKI